MTSVRIHNKKNEAFSFGLYPVITEEFCKGRDMLFVLEQVLRGGIKIVQLRQKNKTVSQMFSLAQAYRAITRQHKVKLIINDHVDIALAVDADGVHLGQEDFPCHAARKIAPHLLIGVSTHNREEILRAEEEGASYINIGPIFDTRTKSIPITPLGLSYLKNVRTKLPFSVMGGIKKNNLMEVLACGAKNIAMVTEITESTDICATVKDLVETIDYFKRNPQSS
jgi:thiamine-phosphate pyrophosphorylase